MSICIALLMASAFVPPADTEGPDAIPPAFAPFESMIGAWKGVARPSANRLRGWNEKHAWGWTFKDGKPVGMSLAVEGGKTFKRGLFSFDPKTKKYTFTATDPADKPIVYVGSAQGKTLVLERSDKLADGAVERLTIRPTSNLIRYTMLLDRKEPRSPQYKNTLEVGLTKEGESFAAGGAGSNLPKCIITGGAGTLSVTHNGVTYPVCCTGCVEQFKEDPEKYIARAKARANAEKSGEKPKKAKGADDGEFDGLVEPPAKKG
ncbi:MAG: hypothetical protein SFX72_20015 [Isosphaeraceae bacterium]|nr:hypothetical protein [Isosphaeraceae bacterium]